MRFYLAAASSSAPTATEFGGVPGGGLFREKTRRCARAAFGGARWRPKASQVARETPQVVKMEPKGSKWVPSESLLGDLLSLFW